MATPHHEDEDQEIEIEEGEYYIEDGEVFQEVPDDGDQPMEDEDDEAADTLGALPDEDDGPYENNSIQQFTAHNISVFCVSAHPTFPIAASGGEDDLAYIWDLTTGEPIVTLTGHTDSVTGVEWSADGNMIATGGMDGKVRIWRRVGSLPGKEKAKEDWTQWDFLTELQGPDEVMWLQWHPKGLVLLAGSNDSTVWLWQLPSGNTMQVYAGHTAPVACGTFTPDGKRILTADAEGTLLFWDPREPAPLFKLAPADARFELDGITSLSVNKSSTLGVVGGANGGVRVVSLARGAVVGALAGHKDGESVEAVRFVDIGVEGKDVVVTGGTDGRACVWDVGMMRMRATLEHKDAVTSLLTHPAQPHILVSASADKTLRTWDARSGALLSEHKGHRGPVLAASLGMAGKLVVSAGDDGACLVFTTE